MAKHKVDVTVRGYITVEIEADSEEDAFDAAVRFVDDNAWDLSIGDLIDLSLQVY